MTSQLAIKEEVCFDTMLADIGKMQALSAKLMQSKHYQAMGESGIFAIVQKAKSLNVNPLEALNGGLYYVQGKVGMSSEMMASLIRQQGHSIIKDPKSDNTICILHGKRVDNGDTWTVSFSEADARKAGLYKNIYEKYPAIMLYNRTMSMLARQLFPDVIKGAGYTMDELREIGANKSFDDPRHEQKVQEVKFEEIVQLIDFSKLELLENMIGSDVELRTLITKGFAIGSLEKIPANAADKVIKRVTQILADKEKKMQETIEENRKVMEA